jgi:hypothetical protein
MRKTIAAYSLLSSALTVGLALAACTSNTDSGGAMDASTADGSADAASDTLTTDTTPSHPSDAGVDGDATTACNPATAWPAMLAAAISPLHTAANLDLNHDGTGLVSLAYAESVNCALTAVADAGVAGESEGTWGTHQEVAVYTDVSTSDVASLIVGAGYTGAISFSSRAGGPYGSHTYEIGIGKLDRDGAPMVVDWTNPGSAVNELFDGINATFAPSQPAVTNCNSNDACDWGSSAPGGDSDASDVSYFVAMKTVSLSFGIDSASQGGLVGWIEVDLPNAVPSESDAGSDADAHD